jgi:ribonucleoside-diphosphate reductase alpha chain
MGFADMLIRLGIPYNSREAELFARRLMAFIRRESLKASSQLAAERGVFPNYAQSIYARKNLPLRNATVNTVAPTGTISIIAGCSSGIEPLFAISYVRNVLSGTRLFEINPIFEKVARARGIYKREILAEIARWGTLRRIKGIPRDVKRVFVTAFDVEPEQHLRIQPPPGTLRQLGVQDDQPPRSPDRQSHHLPRGTPAQVQEDHDLPIRERAEQSCLPGRRGPA